jgi:hypothetical protein
MSKTLTIHRALAELKTLDARITKGITEIDPVGVRQAGKPIISALGAVYQDADKFASEAKASFESVQQLIKNKAALKAAIVKSNSETQVTVGGKSMTVAAAITEKSFIALKKTLLERLNALERKNQGNYKTGMEKVEKNLQTLLEASFNKEQVKASPEDVEAIRTPFLKANELHLTDPLEIKKIIAELTEEISKFEADVDACLSESNATTSITIE